MKYLLDTNICIFTIKKRPAEVLERLHQNMDQPLAIASITLAELEYGVAMSQQQERNADALAQFLALVSILPFDEKAASHYGHIRASLRKSGRPIGPLDELIAATAMANSLILVTNNLKEFSRIENLLVEDWTKSII